MSAATTAPDAASRRRSPASAARRRYAAYAGRRLGQALVVIVLAYVLVFLVLAAIPGDPVSAQLENPQAGYSEAEKAQIRSFYGLDQPVLVQLGLALANALRGDLGISLATSTPVATTIAQALPSTLVLAGTALVLALLIALALGFASQRLGEGRAGGLVRALPTVFLSTPNFLIGLVLIQVFAVQLGAFSIIDPESAGATLFAALTLAIPVSAQIAQVLITALDTTAALDHTEVAVSRGLSPVRVFARHLLRPSLLPTVTVCGLVIGELLGGSLITETIFGRAGIGTVVQKAVSSQDVPVLQAAVVLSAAVFVLVNLGIDLVLPALDPRLRTSQEAS
jgi:peptide/nickel transport system permease protein